MVDSHSRTKVDILGETIETRIVRRLVPKTSPWLVIGGYRGTPIQSRGSTAEAAIAN